jgi:hypothetical protein
LRFYIALFLPSPPSAAGLYPTALPYPLNALVDERLHRLGEEPPLSRPGEAPLEADIRRATDFIGVLHRIIRGGERVLVKLNLLSDLPPPAASNPLLLITLSRLPKAAGANEVVVADASFWTVDTSR